MELRIKSGGDKRAWHQHIAIANEITIAMVSQDVNDKTVVTLGLDPRVHRRG
jgi:hypothetical protein